jgi:hypothetical protein
MGCTRTEVPGFGFPPTAQWALCGAQRRLQEKSPALRRIKREAKPKVPANVTWKRLLLNRQFICLAVVIGVSAVLDSFVALSMSRTTDESRHLRYGTRILQFQPDRDDSSDSQMPLSALNALPGAIGAYLDRQGLDSRAGAVLKDFRAARFATILATLVLTILIYFWARDLYGSGPALAASLLCALSPNLIAHGTLITTDMYGALAVVGALFFFHRFILSPTMTNAFLSGFALALAQIAKSFAISLYAIVGVVILCALFLRVPRGLTWQRVFAYATIAAACFVVVINIAYCFDRPFTPLNSYRFETAFFTRLQQVPVIRGLPVPVPYPFLEGLDMMKHNDETGATFGNVYLLGELGEATSPQFHGFKSYYCVALFFKEPIPLQILFIWGLVWILGHRRGIDFLFGEGILLLSAMVLLLWLSCFSRTQIGIRYILPVLAIEIVIASAAFSGFSSATWLRRACLSSLVLWLAISFASYYPHLIPYMNEWSGDRRQTFRLLADSNLDWGQNEALVAEFLARNPDVVLNPPKPVSGRILVNANRLTGVDRWHPTLRYMAKYAPVAHVGYAHFLFVVPSADITSNVH